MTTLEVGAGDSPDPRADITLDIAPLDGVDIVCDLNQYSLPFRNDEFDTIIATHVLEHLDDAGRVLAELSRITKPGGVIEVTVPFGVNSFSDPTHTAYWTFETPEFFVEGGQRPYYFDLPLTLKSRTQNAWFMGFLGLFTPILQRVVRRSPGVWVDGLPLVSGELTTTFEVL
jgi:SAM-dependent methyltransferase